MTWSHRPTGQAGVFEITRGGDVVGMFSLIPEAGWRVDMLVEDAVHGLNHPVPLAERGFGDATQRLRAEAEARAHRLLEHRAAKIRGAGG